MRINSIPPKEIYSRYVCVRELPQTSTQALSPDRVEISSAAKTFSTALKAAKETLQAQDAERAERINTITEQIRNGTYHVPAEKVAEKILGR